VLGLGGCLVLVLVLHGGHSTDTAVGGCAGQDGQDTLTDTASGGITKGVWGGGVLLAVAAANSQRLFKSTIMSSRACPQTSCLRCVNTTRLNH